MHAGFFTFNLRRPPWFVCLVYLLPSNIFYWVLFSFYGTPGDRPNLALNLHSWKTIYLNIIALFLSSFWCTTFIVLLLRCNVSSISFLNLFYEFFAEDFGIKIDEILLKRTFFNSYSCSWDVLEIAVNKLTFYKRLMWR